METDSINSYTTSVAMTVQNDDQYIVCRNEANYRITAERLKQELGGERTDTIMAFYQSVAPYGWEQLNDSEYESNSIPRIYSPDVIKTPQYVTGGNFTSTLAVRRVPVPSHSHAFTDNKHGHSASTYKHNHGVTDPGHAHSSLGGNVGLHQHTTGQGGKKSGPDNRMWRAEDPGNPLTGSILYNADSGTGGGGALPSSTINVTINAATGSSTTSGAKTGVSINDSTDNTNNFTVKYCDVILCRKLP
jgi:hypothetical protein